MSAVWMNILSLKRLLGGGAIFLAFSPAAQAHPVTYQGGWAVMTWNQPMMTDLWVSYSYSHRVAGTARFLQLKNDSRKREFYFPQANLLVKRWNETHSQANIYLSGGYGAERVGADRFGGAGLLAVEADWESRRLYTSAKYQVVRLTDSEPFDSARVRFGAAPYVGEFNDLHTWLVLELQRQTTLSREPMVTPMLRFFYQTVLWEVGASSRGDWVLNFMVHF